MILGVLQALSRTLFAAIIGSFCISTVAAQGLERRPLTDDDQLALNALLDDDIAGNCATAYFHLSKRGLAAKATLISGLDSEDWQQRFLCAVLLAPLDPSEALKERVCRILIGHLPDNQIKGDALVASHALIVIGPDAFPYIRAASWHAEGQFAVQCKLLRSDTNIHNWSFEDRARASTALANYYVSLRWLGSGEPSAPAMSVPIPSEAERRQQAFIDLASDHRRANALAAYGFLTPRQLRYWSEPPSKPPVENDQVLQLLENALLDSDRQRRLLAASSLMLRQRTPSTALLKAAMESLKLDDFHTWAQRGVPIANAGQAARFFMRYKDESRPFLLAGLTNESYAVRLRAAAILAQSHDWQVERYVPILIDHLRNNDLNNDATMAAFSLAILGADALPWLEQSPVDAQQAHYFQVIRASIQQREQNPSADIPITDSGMLLITDSDR